MVRHLPVALLLPAVLATLWCGTAAATTKVIVFNHTSKTVRLATTSELPEDHWTAGVSEISAWSQGVVYETNRDEGVTSGESYIFETRLDAIAWRPAAAPLVVRLRLEGDLVGSTLSHSLSDAGGQQHPWLADRSLRRLPWDLVGAEMDLSIQAVFAGTEDDVHIILRETPELPRGSATYAPEAWRGTHLDVLSYNVYMRPRDKPPYAMLNGQDIRAKLLPAQLDNFDVLVLQELFEESSTRLLLSGLVDRGYGHCTAVVGDDVLTFRWVDPGGLQLPKNWNGGVVIASRWPIIESRAGQVLFGPVCSGMDCGADKGAVYAAIDKAAPGQPPLPFHIIGTHLNNGDWPIQRQQLEMVRALIDAADIPIDEPVVIAGDFNIDRIQHPDRYQEMLSILSARDPCPHLGACGHPFTADGTLNDLGDGPRTRVDYVLYSTRHLGSTSGTFARTLVPRSPEPWREFPHEPWMWDLSDHFPVYGSFLFRSRSR